MESISVSQIFTEDDEQGFLFPEISCRKIGNQMAKNIQ